MDLSHPLSSLVPTLDAWVLGVLARTESSLSISRIRDLSDKGSRRGLTLAIDRLVHHGLVTATPANRGHLYSLNRQHVLTEAVLVASGARVTILARLEDRAKQLSPRPLHVSVFGSFARGDGGPDSDIDLLIVLPATDIDETRWHDQLRVLADEIYAWTGNRMECISMTVDELADIHDIGEPVVDSWRRDALTVYGVDFDTALLHADDDR